MNDGKLSFHGKRVYRSTGSSKAFVSPFTTAQQLADRLGNTRGGSWKIETNYIGGHGDMTQAVERDSRECINLWRDARGRWYITFAVGRDKFLPDLDATEALVQSKSEMDAQIERNRK